MARQSAGLLLYRRAAGRDEVFLVHPGGPFWARKDHGSWGIPKGEYTPEERPLSAAQREFHEETGFTANPPFHELGLLRQAGGKVVSAWAFEGDCDPDALQSNLCEVEWPPRSKRFIRIPEVDRGAWFSIEEAPIYLLKSQLPFLERLRSVLTGLDQARSG